MKKRIKIRNVFPLKVLYHYEGSTTEHFCDTEDWKVFQLKYKILHGAMPDAYREDLLDELYDIAYEEGENKV